MAWNPATDSWAPGEPPVGDASVLAPDTHDTPPVKGAVPQQPDFMSDIDKSDQLQHSLVGPAQEAQKNQTAADRQRDDNTQKDRERMDRAWGNENARADDPALQVWDADKEKANRTRGPMEQFGSVGFIFAMAASAFTRTPMTSALNAGAAAMTAIQQGDEKAYEHAYKAWKENSDLAIRRFDMEHRLYEDADKLLTTDMNLWKQKTLEIASQFGHEKEIAMLNAGMDPEVLKSREALIKSKVEVQKYQQNFEEFEAQRKRISEGIKALRQAHPDWKDDNKGLEQTAAEAHVYARAVQATKGTLPRELTGPQEFTRKWWEEHPDGKAEDFSKDFGEFMRGQRFPPGGAGGAGTRPGSAAEDHVKIDADIRKEHPDWTDKQVIEERNRTLKASTTSLTGNEKKKVEERIDKFRHSNEIIDKTLKVLETHSGAAGIAGKVMRLEERISNILPGGSKNSDRVQMMRDIELLRGWAKELLFSSNSKLKKEAERVDSIVGGTSAGDTGPNTIRALRDLKSMYDQMSAEDQSRLSGTWKPPVEGEKPAPKAGKTPWSRDPIVSP